jgi:excisionase family DNA binding protein
LDRSTQLEPLLTVTQCCELLQVSKQTLYRLIRNGELEPIRVGHRARFTPATVRAYIHGAAAATYPGGDDDAEGPDP